MESTKYEISEQAFIDTWNEFGSPKEITELEMAIKFMNSLIDNTKGLFIADHITYGNYDCVNSVILDAPYLRIQWKDFNKYRIKYLNNELTEDEELEWCIFGYATYDYMLFKFKKIKFENINNHLYIGFELNLSNLKEYKKWMESKNFTPIDCEDTTDFEIDYIFFEGKKEDCKKHICRVNNLPFYTILLQPKENCSSLEGSRKLLLCFTCNEIANRLENAKIELNWIRNEDQDSLFDIGNRIRRILEYFFKYFCVYSKIDMSISKRYSYLMLGDLKNAINKLYPNLVKQSIINTANDFSHDSGKVSSKEECVDFIKEVELLFRQMFEILDDR